MLTKLRLKPTINSRMPGRSVHVEYKRSQINQYFKEERALPTETTFNDTYDFGVGRGLSKSTSTRACWKRSTRATTVA
jgi:hypothetical protein